MSKKKFAVVLSGCGVFDGSEIHEAVATLLAVDKKGLEYQCFAPDIKQSHVKNHLAGSAQNEERNVLIESARIARGKILSLEKYSPNDYDGIIFPGGFGAALNLCSFAVDGVDCKVDKSVEKAVLDTFNAKKPIGALCIAPALIARILGKNGVKLTIGNDSETASAIEKAGAKHENKKADEILIDETNKIVTCPCYMLAKSISEVFEGAEKVVLAMINL